MSHTVWCHYNVVNFLKNINKRCPIAHPLGRGMGCLLWIQHLIDILPQFLQSLSHPRLYVFSSFLPPHPRPPLPLPQWLLLLASKLLELDLRYLGHRKYGCGKMYWVTFGWPSLKVTAVTLINKNLLVCRIKKEPLNQSLQNFVAISLRSWLSPN